MNVLFIGGTGIISTEVTRLCVKKDINVTVFNRGTNNHILPKSVHTIIGNIYDEEEAKKLLKGRTFDVVVEFIAFGVDALQRDVRLFKGITKQFIFISSASAYQKPVQDFPITEKTPLENPFWDYSRSKIECEEYIKSQNSDDFNVTIIRPSHTYNDNHLMLTVKEWGSEYTLLKRIQDGLPYIIPGDGTSLWTITHSQDFAKAFVEVLGNEKTYGEEYHITSDKIYTWDQLYELTCKALQVEPNKVYIPTDFILEYMPHKVGEFYGDKHYSVFFDNSKIKTIAPDFKATIAYEDVVSKAVNHYLTTKELQYFDEKMNTLYEKIINDYQTKIKGVA